MNDNTDIAYQFNMDGVHLGQSDGCVIEARARLGKDKIVGLTVETWDQLVEAQSLPIDYVAISSLFATQTKTDIKHIWGLEGLEKASRFSTLPLVVIGGINLSNIQALQPFDIEAIALTSAISEAKQYDQAVEALIQGLVPA